LNFKQEFSHTVVKNGHLIVIRWSNRCHKVVIRLFFKSEITCQSLTRVGKFFYTDNGMIFYVFVPFFIFLIN